MLRPWARSAAPGSLPQCQRHLLGWPLQRNLRWLRGFKGMLLASVEHLCYCYYWGSWLPVFIF